MKANNFYCFHKLLMTTKMIIKFKENFGGGIGGGRRECVYHRIFSHFEHKIFRGKVKYMTLLPLIAISRYL